ncbi:MAG: molybdopterin molybdotransferase MoeA [Phycisphaerales bacterium]|nr:molybdopterin molybdotransferase MoeA [Phycisphaerales bacterium]
MTPPASPAEAVAMLIGHLSPVGTERARPDAAAGRVTAEPLRADRDSPASDVSAMDGYAVRIGSLAAGTVRVCGEVRIGHGPPALEAGCAVRIVTGGGVPAGADAVVKREDVDEHDARIGVAAATLAGLRQGQNIRRRGENLRAGDEAVPAGCQATPAVMGTLATFGASDVLIYRRVRVATLVTGDEVRPPGEPVSAWQLRDSNGPVLRAMLAVLPWVELLPHVRVPDDPAALAAAVAASIEASDAIILTGGVSMGHRDFVPGILRGAGTEAVFHKVPQRPGRPVLGAVGPRGQAVLGLPGNPLSVMVTARRMGVPVLRHLAGITRAAQPPRVRVEDDGKRLDLWWHRLVRLDGTARIVATRGSGDIPSAARSDGFVEVPPGGGGGERDFYPWTPH